MLKQNVQIVSIVVLGGLLLGGCGNKEAATVTNAPVDPQAAQQAAQRGAVGQAAAAQAAGQADAARKAAGTK